MKRIEEYTPCELATLATVVGVLIAAKLNVNEQNVIGNFLTGVAQSILIIASQAQNIEAQEENQCEDNGKSNIGDNNKHLQKQIDELREYIKKFEDNMNC
jgi:hypothetical protein